jgi:hypothetical protein
MGFYESVIGRFSSRGVQEKAHHNEHHDIGGFLKLFQFYWRLFAGNFNVKMTRSEDDH